jgi:hypothetical protein
MQAEGQKFDLTQWRKIFYLFLYKGTKMVHLSLSFSIGIGKMSIVPLGDNSGVAVTISKDADYKAHQRV